MEQSDDSVQIEEIEEEKVETIAETIQIEEIAEEKVETIAETVQINQMNIEVSTSMESPKLSPLQPKTDDTVRNEMTIEDYKRLIESLREENKKLQVNHSISCM